ncbi:MAG: ABC transporter ATP-binding protein [Elusimicrobiota bacterium]
MLKLRNLESGYGNLKVLRKVSLHINPGEIVTIIGANGAGKSTLLNTISGVIKPRGGEIYFSGNRIDGMPPEKIVTLGTALIPEGRELFASMSVYENLRLGAYPQYTRKNVDEINLTRNRVHAMFPVLKDRQYQLAGTLSGGEQQMLALSRALMSNPKLIMMDEPSMGLAPLVVKKIFEAITQLRKDGITILLVEQNAKLALSVADRGYVMETGQVMIEGTSADLLNNRDVQRAYLGKEYKKIND